MPRQWRDRQAGISPQGRQGGVQTGENTCSLTGGEFLPSLSLLPTTFYLPMVVDGGVINVNQLTLEQDLLSGGSWRQAHGWFLGEVTGHTWGGLLSSSSILEHHHLGALLLLTLPLPMLPLNMMTLYYLGEALYYEAALPACTPWREGEAGQASPWQLRARAAHLASSSALHSLTAGAGTHTHDDFFLHLAGDNGVWQRLPSSASRSINRQTACLGRRRKIFLLPLLHCTPPWDGTGKIGIKHAAEEEMA